ncbi:bacteriocin immunity protein [Leuconostoc falkenbergense]|uniref:bacteriocin immunity protein n=1 Tax=Leuconostoc falkenbergense TaxID=2766470 RepID=UPI001665C9E3|nr:bacteriocin immunity protein [Leuconostoc falkenbergense]MCT4403890.1 bacteriocin immunity protein [Leuconostoc falkenbergense]
MTKRNVTTVIEAKHNIELLYLSLQSKLIVPGIRDITDVLLQVNKKIDTSKNPEALVNRMVNYIRITASSEKLHFSKADEKMIIDLGVIGQRAGLNGQYMADFSDKSQFYSYADTYR